VNFVVFLWTRSLDSVSLILRQKVVHNKGDKGMKRVLVALLTLGLAFPAFANDRYIIKDDVGGDVAEFKQAVDYFKREKLALKIDGYCASACTLILDKNAKIDICVTPKALFLIHSPYALVNTPNGPKPTFSVLSIAGADKILKSDFLAVYPEWLTDYLKGKRMPSVAMGDSPSDMIKVDFETASKHIPVCDSDKAKTKK